MAEHIAIIPSQVVHPWKATIRTFLAVLAPYVGLVLAFGPEVIRIVAEELRGHVPDDFLGGLLAVGLFLAAVAAAATRIMAIPRVNQLLGRIRLDAGSATLTK
jgi:uncharacterized sodium:solute symporter family permease YidK